MSKIAIAAAALVLAAATSPSWAQDFNPGTVVGNVLGNPASGCGYGYGFDCYRPVVRPDQRVWVYRPPVHKRNSQVKDVSR
jgi:hypothetical protein